VAPAPRTARTLPEVNTAIETMAVAAEIQFLPINPVPKKVRIFPAAERGAQGSSLISWWGGADAADHH